MRDALVRQLAEVRAAAQQVATLDADVRTGALRRFAELIDERRDSLLTANAKDLAEQEGRIADSLYQRLKLDGAKIDALVVGIRQLADAEDPLRRVLDRTLLDDGLVLERLAVPIGVIGVVFESRPDVIPQILSLILRSGNAAVLKGGREALHSNRAFLELVRELNREFSALPPGWAVLLETREEVRGILDYPEFVDLVIPRGSNELVRSIQDSTRIPVLGHAEGVCHVYVHGSADVDKAVDVAVDSKVQYPSACNALETLLVDASIAETFLPSFATAAAAAGIDPCGCEATRRILPQVRPATDDDWRAEYGDLRLAIRIVDGIDAAIDHIHEYGSGHTESILAEDTAAADAFLRRVDSACVFANSSTRFADGFRFGLGAEVGISTNKTHARGPVGVDGLMIYKYVLRGAGQVVRDYAGNDARPFKHERLD